MHSLFADWYSEASIDPRSLDLSKRWLGVEAAAKGWSTKALPELLRIALRRAVRDPAIEAVFRSHFKNVDETFQMRGNAQELAVLACAVCIEILESTSVEQKRLLAELFQCSRLGSAVPAVADMATEVERFCASRAVELRAAKTRLEVKLPATKKIDDTIVSLRALAKSVEDPAQAAKTIALSYIEVANVLKALMGTIEQIGRGVREADAVHLEESDILWWLFGSRSAQLNQRLKDLPPELLPVVVGSELAIATAFVPGPVALNAFIDKAFTQAGQDANAENSLEVITAVVPAALRDTLVREMRSDVSDFLPIHAAIIGPTGSTDGTTWRELFGRDFLVTLGQKFPVALLTHQLYHERLLLRVLEGA